MATTLEDVRKSAKAVPWTELNCDKHQTVLVNVAEQEWLESAASGVARKMIERLGGEVARCTTVVRYLPNSSFPEHEHSGGEEFLVIDGVWKDDFGVFPKFSYIRNYIGSRHTPTIPEEGCTILVRLRQMAREEPEAPHTSWDCAPGAPGWKRLQDGRLRLYVYASRFERVLMEQWPAGAEVVFEVPEGTREVFVAEGSYTDWLGEHGLWSWSRYAKAGELVTAKAGPKGCYLYMKEGHRESPEVSVERPKP